MSCKYQYYDKDTYLPRLMCSIDDGYCIYSKRCDRVHKFIPLDSQKECYKMILEEQKNIPIDSYFIQTYRANSKGDLYLYVIINDKVERIVTKLKEIHQNYIYLKEGLEGYEVSLVPFPKEKEKRTYKKRVTKSEE